MTFFHYTGHLLRGLGDPRWQTSRTDLENLVGRVMDDYGVSRIYGSLACGADLLVVEQALKRGIDVVAFVPYGLEQFERLSVAIGGDSEVARYRRVLDQLSEVRLLPLAESADISFRLTSDRAMKAVREDARVRGAHCFQLALWDGLLGEQGTAGDVKAWAESGGHTVHLKLPEGELQPYNDQAIIRLNSERIASYRLGDEVERAWRAATVGLREAAVLYAARLLEGIFRSASKRLNLALKTSETHAYIEALAGARCLDESVRVAAHALRRVGNEVRHVQRSLGEDEHWIALAFARLIVRWYGSDFRGGLQLPKADLSLPSTGYDWLIEKLLHVQTPEEMVDFMPELHRCLKQAPLLATIAIEKAIDLKLWHQAERLIQTAQRMESRNRRILELRALLFSRRGQPERAIELLSPLKIRPFDSELPGILAGAHKRVWQQQGNALHLHKASNLYMRAWRSTQSPYVGINAAACQSWRGNEQAAREISLHVIKGLEQQASHWPQDDSERVNWDFYSLATMAEAHWLCGEYAVAEEWEGHALTSGREQGAPVEVFVEQMAVHRQRHKLSGDNLTRCCGKDILRNDHEVGR